MAQWVKNSPATQKPQIQSLGREDPLKEDPLEDPLQSSCLENPEDRGAWWATVQSPGGLHALTTEGTHFL